MLFSRVFVILLLVAQLLTAQPPIDERLRDKISPLVQKHKGEVGLAVMNLDTGQYCEFNDGVVMPTASLIKLPVLITAYRLADRGEISLEQRIALKTSDKVPGSGILSAHFQAGATLSLRDYLRLMIRYSDNTATNVVLEHIGLDTTSKHMSELGLGETQLHAKVYRGETSIAPERSQKYGLGSTNAKEMVKLLTQLHRGELVSKESTEQILAHLRSCDDDTKLAANLPPTTRFAHKTGAVASSRTDAGLMRTAQGTVAVCFLTTRNSDQSWAPENDANQLAAEIGRIIVEHYGPQSTDKRLRRGSVGSQVESLQRTLNARLTPSPNLAVDGDFGPATEAALKRFQGGVELDTSGIVDKRTWQALGTILEHDQPVPEPEVVNSEVLPRQLTPKLGDPPILTAKAWIIVDSQSGDVVAASHQDQALHGASTTKIMTAHLVIQYAEKNPGALDEWVSFSKRADQTRGSTAGLREGEKIRVRDLLFGLLLPSGNDASVALAEHFGSRLVGRDVQPDTTDLSYRDFISAMNREAKALGLKHTHYDNPHGLSTSTHLTSAADLSRLSRRALRSELFSKIVNTRQYGVKVSSSSGYQRNLRWTNTNRLLTLKGFSGVKTGTTTLAGACLVGIGERDSKSFLIVILGSSSSPARYADIRNLFRWAWANTSTSH